MRSSYALYLDDVRYPPRTGEDWVLVRTVAAMRELLEERGIPALASFDYELGRTDPSHSGEDAVAAFINYVQSAGHPDKPVELEIRLHTSSGYGAARMAAMFVKHGKACEQCGVRFSHAF